MRNPALVISSCFGLGYARGGGTLASIACCIAWYFTLKGHEGYGYIPLLVTIGVLAVGVWSAGEMEAMWGKDSYRIVIDEVAGMSFSLLFIPVKWPYILAGLALFRFFDIVKPLYIRRTEAWKGGWGVMMDDVVAGIYSNLVLQGLVLLKLW
jgi:phosphatidylglycerophosphatase A